LLFLKQSSSHKSSAEVGHVANGHVAVVPLDDD
jgi:hypothetical protein